jgi:hypothetical protein
MRKPAGNSDAVAAKPAQEAPRRDFPAQGMRYHRFLNLLHRSAVFDWYLEIGCRSGATFAESRSKTIAVDPFFRVKHDVIQNKRVLHVFQMTSDDFFGTGFLEALKIRLSFSFIDGMHLFEYALRDFMHAEENSDRHSAIAIHDCCPWSNEVTTRDLRNLPPGGWTGDVWKLIPILQKYRPDLTLTVLDSAPSGLLLVTGLDPKSRTLREAYEEIVAEFTGLDLSGVGMRRFYGSFQFADSHGIAGSGFSLLKDVPRAPEGELATAAVTP